MALLQLAIPLYFRADGKLLLVAKHTSGSNTIFYTN